MGAFGGSKYGSEIGKDAVRYFTTPSLPADLDLKPNVVINGEGFAAVRVEGKIVWYRIIPPEAPDPVAEAAADPVSVRVPDTRETYLAVTNPAAVNQLTDRFLQQHLPPVDYERYRQDMAVLRQTQELLQEKNPPQLVDGEWVRVTVDFSGDNAAAAFVGANTMDEDNRVLTPVTPQEAWLLNRAREIQNTPGANPSTPSLSAGLAPDGGQLNVWLGGGNEPRHIWVQGSDGELIKVIDQGNGVATEQRFNTSNGQLQFAREFNPDTQQFRVTTDHRPPVDSPATADSYVVQRGDTLGDIATRHGTTVAALVEANPQLALNPDLIHTNQRLTIPGLGVKRELSGELGEAGEDLFTNGLPQAYTPPVSPSPRLDENGMPLPEIREGAAYDPNTDPVYATLLDAFRNAQQSDQSIPADALQFAAAGTATTTDVPASSADAASPTPPAGGAPAGLKLNHLDAAQGFQSALSFIQALEQGNELSAAVAGVSMLNAFAKASGVPQADLPFSPTTTSSLGALSAAFNLRDALKADDSLAAWAAGTNMAAQIGQTYVYATNSLVASGQQSLAQASPVINGLGNVAGVLGIANSLKHGDEVGAGASALMLASQLSWIGPWGTAVGLAIGIARALFGGDDPPEPRGTAEARWAADGSLSVAVTEDDDGGGESARGMMQSMLDTLNGYLGQQTDPHGETANGPSLARGPRLDPIGDPQYALIPQRLPTVSFFQREYAEFMLNYTDQNGNRVTRHYNGQGQRLGLDGSVESTFAEDFIKEAVSQNALVPTWEAETIRQRMAHGDTEAWKDEVLSAPEATKAGLMALTFHLPGISPSPSFPLPEGEGGESAPGGRGEEDPSALTPTLSRGERGNGLSARFDLDGDSYLDPVDWTQPYQAFLALDRDQNGIIDSGRELVTFTPGPHPGPLPGGEGDGPMHAARASIHSRVASLEWLDANHDGVLNADDPAFGVLRLWLDVNSNAGTDNGELATLADLGITAIDFRTGTPKIVDAEGNTHPLAVQHLQPKGEGARIAGDAGGTQIELQDGYRALYLRAGDARIQSAAPSLTVQQELARHASNLSREAQGMFGGHAALLTGLAVAQTAAAGNAPAAPLTLNEAEQAIAAAQSARTLGSDGHRPYSESATATPTVHADGDRTSSAPTLPSPSFPLPEGEGSEPRLAWRAPDNLEGTPDYPLDTGTTTSAPAFTNPLTTGEIIAGSEDTAIILAPAALLANDVSRNQGAQLRISAVGNAVNGTVALLDTGEVVFTPALNYFGPASFTYTVSDQWGYASQALATVNLASVNDAPIIEAIEFGRPIFGYQSVTVRNYSYDWQPGWAYDSSTGQYYQDVPILQAVNNDTTALSLLATNSLLTSGGSPITPSYYQSGQLRPIAFDAIDATQVTYDDNGNPIYTRIDDPTRMQGRVISYDIDGDSTAITYSLGGNPAHGHASVGWLASADAEPWPTVQPDQLGNYAQYQYGAWQYASHPGDGYTGGDPFQVAVTDDEGGVTLATVNAWHYGTNQGGGGKKPVALDLNGNGLDFVGLDDSNVYFDVNGDGWREHIAWVGANDGLLVLDTEGDRVIDKPEEIAFARYYPGAVTDLEGLRAFDENRDGILDRLDARYKDFAVWQDANLNGLSEEGEVRTLEEMGIAGVNLTSDQQIQTLARGDVTLFGTGTYTTTDGQTHALGDAMFRYTDEVLVTEAEIMRQARVFTEMSAGFTAAAPATEPLASLDGAAPDPALIAYDDPTGLMAGK